MRESKAIQVIAALVTAGAVASMLIIGHGGFGAGLKPALLRAAGAALGRQALSCLKPGGQIVVITRDTDAFQNPASDLLLAGFERELRLAHASISTLQRLQIDPLRLVEVPSGDFQNWIHHAAAGDVIVSFMGPPLFTSEQRRQLGEIQPAVVAFCPGNWPERVDFRSLFATGVLRAAVVARPNPTRAAPGAGQFDQHFTIVTQANVDDFSGAAEKPLASQSR